MTVREQIVNLQPGDVVQFRFTIWPEGTFLQGPLEGDGAGALFVGGRCVRHGKYQPPRSLLNGESTLTVLARKPRPLYVNHPRTEAVPGDVVRDADDDDSIAMWFSDGQDETTWCTLPRLDIQSRPDMPARLRLLVDGETGQVVQ
jgi:hypothetical protein